MVGVSDEKIRPKSRLTFRNYAPHDDSLNKSEADGMAISPPKRQRLDENQSSVSSSSAADALKDALLQAKQEISKPSATLPSSANRTEAGPTSDLSAMAPKKLNWDLKRDIEDRLARLERRTQKAIVEMLKERLEREVAEQGNSEESDLD